MEVIMSNNKGAISVKLKAKWNRDSSVILKSNVFRVIYTPTSSVLYVGLVDPEDMLPEDKKTSKNVKNEKITEIKTLARYSLDHDEIIRLKNEIDKAVEGLRKSGAIKDAK
jgi:hypothetical protein